MPRSLLVVQVETANHVDVKAEAASGENRYEGDRIMQARMKNPVIVVPGAQKALQMLSASVHDAGIPETTFYLIHLRASQINGCSVCTDMHSRELEYAGEPTARIFAVASWREAPYFTDAERAALALTEAVTRLADRPDPVPDEVWEEAARHYSEPQLSALVISIAGINAWNRINAATRQISGEWVAQLVAPRASQPA
jgi:AhpD family alkylhydroperoxidase